MLARQPHLLPCALALFLAAGVGAAQDGRGGNRGRGAPAEVGAPAGATTTADSAAILVGISRQGAGTTAHVMTAQPFSCTAYGGVFPGELSGLARYPSATIFALSGGHADGGNCYYYAPPTLIGPIPSGVSAIPALAFNAAGNLFGSADLGGGISNGLVEISPFMPATILGPFGGGIVGVDALAFEPGSLFTLYGSTGFAYDGSPGDVLRFNVATGAMLDTGSDLHFPGAACCRAR